MKRFFILAALLSVLVECQSADSNLTDPMSEILGRESLKQIEFAIRDTSVTKGPNPITALSEFNVSATTGAADREASRLTNVVFENRDSVFRSDAVWPSSDPGYHFYASNVTMSHTASGQTVDVSSIDKDIVCAYLANPGYKMKNELIFNHILARVGTVSFSNLDLCSNVKLSMEYCGSGTYNIGTGKWSDVGRKSTKELTTADNDFWIIPGNYQATLDYTDANGTFRRKTLNQDFLAGSINNISAKLDGNVVVKTEDEYEAPTFTLGPISDIPAGGGDSGTPSVTAVGQRRRVKNTLADGTVKYNPDWTAVSRPDYTIQYGNSLSSLSDDCPSYHGDNLGTTVRERSKKGPIYVSVSANGMTASQSIDVYQAGNYIVDNTVSLSERTIDAGSSCTATYNGVWASGSSVTGYWSSDNSSVASVSGSSKTATVTGKKRGETRINFNPDGGEQCYAGIYVQGATITKTETEVDTVAQNYERNDGHWARINGKTSDSKDVDAVAGSISFTATAGYVHHTQTRMRTRTRTKITWSDGSVTYGDWSPWSDWSDTGEDNKTPKTATPELSSNESWLKTDGNYEANTGTSARTAKITASYGESLATLTVTQEGKPDDDYGIDVE